MRALACPAVLLTAALLSAQSGWSPPMVDPVLSDPASDLGSNLSFDGLTLYFSSYRSGAWEIWRSTRATTQSPWNAPVLVTELAGSGGVDGSPFLRADGLELFFSRSGAGGQGSIDLMRATRPSVTAQWGTPVFVTELNSTGADDAPSLTADGLTLFMLSNRAGSPGGGANGAIWMATRPSLNAPFSTPTLVSQVSSTQAERDPEISANGLKLVFIRQNRSTGLTDVMLATRTSTSQPFDPPVAVPELSASGNFVLGPTLSADGHTIYLSENLGISGGSYEIESSRFDGLTTSGIAGTTGTMSVHYVDTPHPSFVYLGVFSFGSSPGFALGSRQVPLNADALFLNSVGGIAGLTTGYAGVLDATGAATATLGPVPAALVGVQLWTGFFTLDGGAPFGIGTISNSVELEFVN